MCYPSDRFVIISQSPGYFLKFLHQARNGEPFSLLVLDPCPSNSKACVLIKKSAVGKGCVYLCLENNIG